jgi:hypothetical protein
VKLKLGTVVVVVEVVEVEVVLEDPAESGDVQAGTSKMITVECGVTFSVLCQMPFQSLFIANTRMA